MEVTVQHHTPLRAGPTGPDWGMARRWTPGGRAPIDPDEPVVHISCLELMPSHDLWGLGSPPRPEPGEGGDLGPGVGCGSPLPAARRSAGQHPRQPRPRAARPGTVGGTRPPAPGRAAPVVEVGEGAAPADRRPTGRGRAAPDSWSQVAAFSHSASVGSRAPKRSCDGVGLEPGDVHHGLVGVRSAPCCPQRPAAVHSPVGPVGPALGVCDVVLLLPPPTPRRRHHGRRRYPPPSTNRQVRGVGDRRAADPERAHVGVVPGQLVVVGEDALAARRSCTAPPGIRTLSSPVATGSIGPGPRRGTAGAWWTGVRARSSAASSRRADARGAGPARVWLLLSRRGQGCDARTSSR